MSAGPSIADLLDQSHRALAATDARVYRRVGQHIQHTTSALNSLQNEADQPGRDIKALLGRGSFLQQPVASLKKLCKEHGIKGFSKLPKAALAKALEAQGVTPPPPPLESLSKKQLIALVRELSATS